MLRHLSTGSSTLAALMAADRRDPERPPAIDVRRLLAELGDHMPPVLAAGWRPDRPAAAAE